MAFEIKIADPVADATEISRLVAAVFKNVEPFKSIFQNADSDEYQKWAFGFIYKKLNAPGIETFKVVETAKNKIVAQLMIQHPYVKDKGGNVQSSSSLPDPPAGTNVQLYIDSFTLLERIRADNGFDSEKDYMGSQVVTHPEYQRQGHAKRLVKLGLKFADEAGKKWYAACLAASIIMYQNLGFEFQTEETIDLSQYGSTGKATVAVLTREPQPVDLFAQEKTG